MVCTMVLFIGPWLCTIRMVISAAHLRGSRVKSFTMSMVFVALEIASPQWIKPMRLRLHSFFFVPSKWTHRMIAWPEWTKCNIYQLEICYDSVVHKPPAELISGFSLVKLFVVTQLCMNPSWVDVGFHSGEVCAKWPVGR